MNLRIPPSRIIIRRELSTGIRFQNFWGIPILRAKKPDTGLLLPGIKEMLYQMFEEIYTMVHWDTVEIKL